MLRKRTLMLFALGMFIFPGSILRANDRRAVKVRPPRYPQLAARMRVQGTVKLNATVESDGRVSDVKVVSGKPMLAGAATQAVQDWKYEPSNEKSTQSITVDFALAH